MILTTIYQVNNYYAIPNRGFYNRTKIEIKSKNFVSIEFMNQKI